MRGEEKEKERAHKPGEKPILKLKSNNHRDCMWFWYGHAWTLFVYFIFRLKKQTIKYSNNQQNQREKD